MTRKAQIECIHAARQALNTAFDAVSIIERDFQLARANQALDKVLTHLEEQEAERQREWDRMLSKIQKDETKRVERINTEQRNEDL